MSVQRKLIKTPLGTVLYLWIDGGLVPYDVLRQEWLEDGRREKKDAAFTNQDVGSIEASATLSLGVC